MDATGAVVDLERGTITDVFDLTYSFVWAWSGPNRGSAAFWVGDPNGTCFVAAEFTIHGAPDGAWVEWRWPTGQSRWRPDRDDEEGYIPKPSADVYDALEGLILGS